MAFLVFLFAQIVSDSLAATDDDSAGLSDNLATTDSQLVSQTIAADDRSRSNTGSLEKSGLEMVTNRRKVLTESSTLGDVVNEDVVSPQETVLVIQAANSKSGESALFAEWLKLRQPEDRLDLQRLYRMLAGEDPAAKRGTQCRLHCA